MAVKEEHARRMQELEIKMAEEAANDRKQALATQQEVLSCFKQLVNAFCAKQNLQQASAADAGATD